MRISARLRPVHGRSASTLDLALLLSVGLAVGGCGGSSSGGGSALGGSFGLESSSVTDGQVWQINRPIEFAFNKPVDFSTVNPNTIQIADLSGQPAVGTFLLKASDSRVVIFQPRCPTKADFSDAGLKPGGRQYRIRISDQDTGAGSILSTDGQGVAASQSVLFSTPQSTFPPDLFLDPVIGAPTPVQGFVDGAGNVRGTRFELQDGTAVLPFRLNTAGEGVLPPEEGAPAGSPPQRVPLNLYSDISSRFTLLVEFNQPVLPTAENIATSRVRIEFQNGGEWIAFPTRLTLVANCTDTGATLALTPVGVLPQNRVFRVYVGPEFEDLVGDRNILALTDFATMTSVFFTEDGTPGGLDVDFRDEVLEDFILSGSSPASLEDRGAVFPRPRATWAGGQLSPAFDFQGNGGPGGNFDWHIPPNTEFVLDTSSTLILGGPGGIPTSSQLVVNGLVNVRNLLIPATSTLRVQGPNPARFLCSGTVQILGLLTINGNNAQPVYSVNSPSQPEPGALGNGGGGSGGIGSFLTNQTTTRGGDGNGAFGQIGGGGQGGESGWNPDGSSNGILRRAAGGGGGTFGPDVLRTGHAGSTCPDQAIIGLDAESGFPGAVTANSALRTGETMPWGGRVGPQPFGNVDSGDDFWGTLLRNFAGGNPQLVTGELPTPWAGAGGGAGGDATRSASYPPAELIPTDHNKGAGGGGGAGALSISALGDIRIGAQGRIWANGGHGSGGENTAGTNRIGGGSGGGSGGHIVLQSAGRIDLSAVPNSVIAISARGGQGGAGADDLGGAATAETAQAQDSIHSGNTGPGTDNPFLDPVPGDCLQNAGGTAFGVFFVRGAGGDGGPGLVQMHVASLPGDVIGPGNSVAQIGTAVRPKPVGYSTTSNSWVDQLLPTFSRFSQGQSRWIPLGGVSYSISDPLVLNPIEFLFQGTDAGGLVQTSGGTVVELPPLLAPATPLEEPGLPDIASDDPRVLLVDADELSGADVVYRLNPNLLRQFRVRIGSQVFVVQSAEILSENAGVGAGETTGEVLALRVSSAGPTLPAQGLVQVIPRYFGISTDSVADGLPSTASVKIDFQAAPANADGDPDEANLFPGNAAPQNEGWASSISTLNVPGNVNFRFFRFRVIFDLANGGGSLTVNTPRPVVEFLRVPFEF